jgi:hypothetical protein
MLFYLQRLCLAGVIVTLTLTLFLLRLQGEEKSFSWRRFFCRRGEGRDEGRRRRRQIHPPAGWDECFFASQGFGRATYS